MTDKDEWNVCLKKLPHQYAVLIKTLVKASPLQDVSAKKQELLKQANAIMNELNVNIDKHKTFKISDFQKNGLVDPPYKVDAGISIADTNQLHARSLLRRENHGSDHQA